MDKELSNDGDKSLCVCTCAHVCVCVCVCVYREREMHSRWISLRLVFDKPLTLTLAS